MPTVLHIIDAGIILFQYLSTNLKDQLYLSLLSQNIQATVLEAKLFNILIGFHSLSGNTFHTNFFQSHLFQESSSICKNKEYSLYK
jgi:hypothetical protein